MSTGFQCTDIDVRTSDGLNDSLLEDMPYTSEAGVQYRAPFGGTTDGLSVPRCLQNIIPATGGDWMSGVLHDSAYRNQLEVLLNNVWEKANLTQKASDNLLLEAMKSQGVNVVMRYIIWGALRLFGWKAFKDDRKKVYARRKGLYYEKSSSIHCAR